MKTIIVSICTFFFLTGVHAQFVNFDWAKSLDRRTGLSWEETYLVGVDASKNVYLAGNFRNTMDLDPGPAVFNVSSNVDNMFVCKLDSVGNFIWGKQMGGSRFTIVRALYVDTAGNVYTTGYFSGTADFDPGPAVYNLTATPYTQPEDKAIFISKLDANGNFQWAKQIGGAYPEYAGSAIYADANGNVFTTGYFINVTDMDPGPGVYNVVSTGGVNAFILKLDQAGNFIFSKVLHSNSGASGEYIKTDAAGNIYTAGKFGGTIDLDPGPGSYNLTAPDNPPTAFMLKLDASGNFIWGRQNMGGAPFAIDAFQNIITYNGSVSKYNVNGNLLWTKITGGMPYTANQSAPLALDATGNIFITGLFRYTQDFDPGPGVYNMTTHGGGYNSDVFISRLDANGNFVWAKAFGSYAEDYAHSLVIDASGNVYTAGIYYFIVDVDPGPGVYNLDAGILGSGVFIHKMSRCPNATTATLNISACNSYSLNNSIYTSSGTYVQSIPNKSGCDSIITLHLTITGSNTSFSATACNSYTWNNKAYTASGQYNDTLTTSTGCDSIIQLNLTIKSTSSSIINAAICHGQNYAGHASSGIYIDTLPAANGCDSIRTLFLTVLSKKDTTLNHSICQGQNYLGYSLSGQYVDTLQSVAGCDSIRTLNLVVNPVYASVVNKTICKGQTYSGHGLPGTYYDTLVTSSGCDSLLTIHLNVVEKPHPDLGVITAICTGDSLILQPGSFQSYLWQDSTTANSYIVKQGGFYSVNTTNVCGSVTAEITINEVSCKVYFPTAFTPNNDGKNDWFKMLRGYNIGDYHLSIYNRYGEKVFETNDYLKGWNGSFKNVPAESGAYVWYCRFKESNIPRDLKGIVTLIK